MCGLSLLTKSGQVQRLSFCLLFIFLNQCLGGQIPEMLHRPYHPEGNTFRILQCGIVVERYHLKTMGLPMRGLHKTGPADIFIEERNWEVCDSLTPEF